MTSFRLEPDVLELFPEVTIAVLVVAGIDNTVDDPEIWAMLEVEIERAAASLGEGEISQHPAVAPWRAAFARFGVKPSKYRSSIESMLRSAQSGRLRPINPLVDLYNTISLRHQLPVGGEDLAKILSQVTIPEVKATPLPYGAIIEGLPSVDMRDRSVTPDALEVAVRQNIKGKQVVLGDKSGSRSVAYMSFSVV